MNFDVPKSIEATLKGVRSLSRNQLALIFSGLALALACYWGYRVIEIAVSEMQSQRRDAMHSVDKSREFILEQQKLSRETPRYLPEGRTTSPQPSAIPEQRSESATSTTPSSR